MINKFINIIFLSFIFSFVNKVNSQDNTFFRKYNLYGMQGGLQLSVTSDGGFIATGQHEGNGGNGECDIYVYRVDLCGNIVWFKLYGTDSQEGGKSIKQTSDGGFIVSGLGSSNTSPRAFNMKLDPNGNIEWAKRYSGDWLFYSHEATNGDFISLAQNSLFRTDAVGNVLWRKYIGFMGSMNLWLDELTNGDIIVTSTGNGSDIYVGRFTSIGDPVWIKKYGTGYSSGDHVEWSSKGVVNSIENSVCVTSPTYLGSQGGENILVMKLNLTDGSLIWSKSVGGPASDQSRDIQLFPGGYAIAGNTASYPVAINPSVGIIQNFAERDALLFTMDENGNEIWSRSYGGDERDKAIGVQYNSDNGFTIAAYTSSSVFGNFDSSMDPLFIKTDSIGIVACQTNSPPLIFQDVSVSITPILTQPSNEGIDSYSFTPNVIDFNPSDSYICQECISTPLFQVSDTAVCLGDTVCFTNTTIIGLTCFQQWSFNGQWFDGTLDPCYSFDTPGDYQIQLMSTCGVNADTFSIVIHVYPIPIVSNQVLTVCSDIACGLTLGNDINGPSASTYNIISINPNGLSSSAGTPLVANGVINSNLIDDAWKNITNAPVNVIYTIVPVSALGCEGSSFTVTLTINPEPVFNVSDVSICADHFVTLTAIPSSYSYNWDHGISNNVPFIPPYTDTYYVIATDPSTGCVQDGNADVVVHPNPIANFTDICGSLPATLTNTSIGAVNYYWDMGDGRPIITTKDIRYSYTIMDSMFYNIILIAETEFGCLDTVSRIFNTPLLFYVPNTFTPDGDEYNNTFIPVFSNKNKVESIHLLIYNRWGEIVFESENIDFGWDGTYKNRKAQDGTYTWELIFTDNSCIGKKEHLYGHVNLIR